MVTPSQVVNALLTQLDKLKQRKNVLVLTTSNLSAAIDPAFVDRADIKQYIGLPPTEAVYWILRSCVEALMRAGLVRTRVRPSVGFFLAANVGADAQPTDFARIQDGLGREPRAATGGQVCGRSTAQTQAGGNRIGQSEEEFSSAAGSCRAVSGPLILLAPGLAACVTADAKVSIDVQGMSGRTLRRLPLLTDAKCASARWSGEAVGVGAFLDAMATVIEEQTVA